MIEAFRLLGEISLRGGDLVQHQLENIGGRVQRAGHGFGGFGLALKGAGLAAGAMGTGLSVMGGALLKTGIGYNSMLENSTVAWTTLMGSQDKAKKQVQDIAAFAAKTQFNTENVDAMAKYFHNAGYEGKALFDQLGRIADVSGAFNISADAAQELGRQMSQVDQAGVAYTSDLDILQNQGVPIFKALAKEMGTNVAGVRKMASEGKITSDVYDKAFNNIADSVKGSADKQAHTFTGMLSTLGDEAGQFAGTLTARLFQKTEGFLTKAVDALGKMNEAFKKGGLTGALEAVLPKAVADRIVKSLHEFKDVFDWVINNWTLVVAGLAGIATALVAFQILTIINTLWKAYREGTILATLANWGLNASLLANPMLWIAIGIGVLVAAIIWMWLNWDKVSKWLHQSWDAVKKKWNDDWTAIKVWGINLILSIVQWIMNKWDSLKAWWNGMLESLHYKAQLIWNTIKSTIGSIISSVYDKIRSTWDSIKSKTESVWEGIKKAIMHPIDTAKSAVGTAIDWIKSKFSGLHISLPNIKVPSFSIQNWSNNPADWLKRMPSVKVSWHAEGGYLDRATLIGAGEAGGEGIVPLEGKHMLPMAQAIGDYLAKESGLFNKNDKEVLININGRELARAIIKDIDQELQRYATIRRRGI